MPPDINVNIDDWMGGESAARPTLAPIETGLEPARDEDLSPEQLTEVNARRKQLAREMERMQAIQERAERLDKDPRECSECGEVEAHYADDFVCFVCRDKEPK